MVGYEISERLVKRICKKYVKAEVSKEGLCYLKEYLNSLLDEISISINEEFTNYNNQRQSYKISKAKRIDVFIIKKCLDELFITKHRFGNGDIGQGNSETMFSQAGMEIA